MPNIGDSKRKSDIVKAAIELFSLYGYKATSVRKIASKVGIRESALYNHFKNKEAIFLHVVSHLFSTPTLFENSEIDSEKLADFKKVFFHKLVVEYKLQSFDVKSEKLYKIVMIELFQNATVRKEFLESYHNKNVKKISEVLFIMMQKGYIHSNDPLLIANEFLSTLFYLRLQVALLRLDGANTTALSTQFERHVDFFWEAIALY